MGFNTAWFTKRVLQAVVTVYVVITLTFVLIRLIPGGPFDYLKAQLMSQGDVQSLEQVNQLAAVYTGFRMDQPLHLQYLDYMESVLFHLDLGRSFWYQEPVAEVYAQALPWTIFLMSTAILINFTISIVVGAMLAYYEGSRFDIVTSVIFQGVASVPYYIAALVLLIVFAYNMDLFPTGSRMPSGVEPGLSVAFFLGVLHHAALPIASLVITQLGRALGMRANSIQVLGEDFIRVAQLRGLSTRRIALGYVAHNAVLPLYTGLMISMGVIFGGSVILETIFNYPGAGWYLYQGVVTQDYTLMMGGFLIITVAVVIAIFIADLTYGLIDPRAQEGEAF